MRTMYQNHEDAQGNRCPIFMLTDQHLKAIIHYKVNRFVKRRDETTKTPAVQDPMIAAMSSTSAWTAREIVGRTEALLEELSPYLQEALVRGGAVTANAVVAMQTLTGRKAGMEAPKAIEAEADDRKWDTIGYEGSSDEEGIE